MTKLTELKNLLFGENPSTPKDRTVVSITDNHYQTKRGVAYRREVNVLKRKSYGYNIVDGDCSSFGAEDFMTNITNLHDVKPGIYICEYIP